MINQNNPKRVLYNSYRNLAVDGENCSIAEDGECDGDDGEDGEAILIDEELLSWLQFNPNTLLFYGVPVENGKYLLQFTVDDGLGESDFT